MPLHGRIILQFPCQMVYTESSRTLLHLYLKWIADFMGCIRTDFRLKTTALIFIFSAILVLYGGVVYSNRRLKPGIEQLRSAQVAPGQFKQMSVYRIQLNEANQFELRCILMANFLLLLGVVFLLLLLLHRHQRTHLPEIPEPFFQNGSEVSESSHG